MTQAVRDEQKAPAPGNPPTPADPDDATAPKSKRGRARLLVAIAVLLAGGGAAFGYWYVFMRGIVYTDDARVAGHLVDVAAQISGRLIEVKAEEGKFVRKGQVVFRLDPASYEAAVKQAEASLLSAKATLQVNQAGLDRAVHGPRPEEIKAAEATVRRLKAQESFAKLEMERLEKLRRSGNATVNELDRQRTAYEAARYEMQSHEHDLRLLTEGTRPEDIEAARAQVALAAGRVAEAQAAVAKGRSNRAYCTVTAPFDGWVVRRWLEPGAMPVPGQPVVSIFDPKSFRIDANIEEKDLYRVAVGDEVTIDVDAYPSLHLAGRVAQILLATNSQFSLVPAEGVSGTFIKVSQRVPLRIAVSPPPGVQLAPGLSAEVRIHVAHEPPAGARASGHE